MQQQRRLKHTHACTHIYTRSHIHRHTSAARPTPPSPPPPPPNTSFRWPPPILSSALHLCRPGCTRSLHSSASTMTHMLPCHAAEPGTENTHAHFWRSANDGVGCVQLSSRDVAARSPRVSPESDRVVYLTSANSGPHQGGSQLLSIDTSNDIFLESPLAATTVVVDKAETHASLGISSYSLPADCFLTNVRRCSA